MQHLCEDIRCAREAQGLSREDIYKKYRVPVSVVRALEENDFENLPAPIYAKGFVGTYCRALGLDATPYIHAIEAGCDKPRRFVFSSLAGDEDEVPEWLDNLRLWAAVFAVVTFGWFAYSLVVEPGEPSDRGRVRAESMDLRDSDPFALP